MKVSIITPTFNRSTLLVKVYESLKKQTNKQFEWIIVDDGSKDDTKAVVQSMIEEKILKIDYYQKENGGKHTAVNLGVAHATGEVALILDSDDTLSVEAVDTILLDYAKYESYPKIACLSYNKKLLNLKKKPKKLPSDTVISNHIQFRYNKGYLEDRAEVWKTDILKQYPFPVFKKEKFLSEAVVWNQIAYDYQTVYLDKAIYIAEYREDGLSHNSIKTRVSNPLGAIANYQIMMQRPFRFKLRIKYSILYNAFNRFASIGLKERLEKGNPFLIILTKPLGDLVYHRWKKYANTEVKAS